MSKVQIRPLQIKKWHGKTGNESFTRAKVIAALVDPVLMTYSTGLDYVNKTYDDPDGGKEKITEAQYYSKILKADLSNQFNLDIPHPFWDSKMSKLKLENRTMILDTNNALDYIRIKIAKASKYVANSQKEYEEGMFPEATHVIFDEREDVEVKASKIALRKQAILKTDKLSKGQKIELILVLSSEGNDYLRAKNLKGSSDNAVEVELDKIIESKPAQLLEYLSRDKEEVATNALILEALQKHVLRKEGHKIMYHESLLGQDIGEVIQYMNKPENQEFKLRVIKQVN